MRTPRVQRRFASSYRSLGVYFDSLVCLNNDALVATDNNAVSYSYWIQFNIPPGPGQFLIWNADGDNIDNRGRVQNSGAGGPNSSLVSNLDLESNNFGAYVDATSPSAANNNSWHHVLVSATLTGDDAIRIYIDGVDVTSAVDSFGTGIFGFNNLPFAIGNVNGLSNEVYPQNGFVGDLAQFWYAPGQSLLVGGDIPPATVAKFYSVSGPVDLGNDGSTPTGTAPAIFLDRREGDDPSVFYTNRGTGGDFADTDIHSLVASLTDPPTQGIDWPLPVIVGSPVVGQTLSYTLDWPRDIISITQSWRRTTTNVQLGTGATLVVPGGAAIGQNIYLITYVTDATGFYPNLSSAEGVYCGPVTT